MNSARPITLRWPLIGQEVGGLDAGAAVSRWVAGTQLESCTRRSMAVCPAQARK
jgi:hypothetical protein